MAVARAASRSGRSPSPAAKALAGAARTPRDLASLRTMHTGGFCSWSPGCLPPHVPPGRNGAHLVSPDMCQPLLPSFVTTSPSATAKWSLSSTLVPPSITPIRTRPLKRSTPVLNSHLHTLQDPLLHTLLSIIGTLPIGSPRSSALHQRPQNLMIFSNGIALGPILLSLLFQVVSTASHHKPTACSRWYQALGIIIQLPKLVGNSKLKAGEL